MAGTYNILNPVKVSRPSSNADAAYGPYNSFEEALAAVPLNRRLKGRTVGIFDENGVVQEYWWMAGVEDTDLTFKASPQLWFNVETAPPSTKVLWVDAMDAATGSSFEPPSGSLLYEMQQQIATLEDRVTQLMKVITQGVLAGDSFIGGRTEIMGESAIGINPTTGETEPIEPITSSVDWTVPNIKIKNDTAANFKQNYRNLLDGELIWVRNGQYIMPNDPGLHIFANNSGSYGFIPVGSGGSSTLDLEATFVDGYILISGSGATVENDIIELTSAHASISPEGYITIE